MLISIYSPVGAHALCRLSRELTLGAREDLLKHRLLGATTRVSDLVGSLDVKSKNLYFR